MPLVYGLDVEFSRTLETSTVKSGGTLTVNLTYTTSDDAIGLIITEIIPPEFRVTSTTPEPSIYDIDNGIIKWLFYSATKVSSGTITYTIDVPPDVSENTYVIQGNWSATSTEKSISGITPATGIEVQVSARFSETITITQTITSPLIQRVSTVEPWALVGLGAGIAIAGIAIAIVLARRK